MSNSYTEDLADIMSGSRERGLVGDIMNAWNNGGLPDDFYPEGARFAFNSNSGYVFLVNEEYQCAMMNGDDLESFYTTPYEGREGFWSDLVDEYKDMHPEDQEYMRCIANGRELPEVTE